MVLRDGYLVLGDLTERLDEVDDCVAVEVARAGEDTIDGNDHALRTETKNKIYFIWQNSEDLKYTDSDSKLYTTWFLNSKNMIICFSLWILQWVYLAWLIDSLNSVSEAIPTAAFGLGNDPRLSRTEARPRLAAAPPLLPLLKLYIEIFF